jgi:aminoglycoside 2'-N-acetyltransferase I
MPGIRVVTTAEASGELLTEIHDLLRRAFEGDFSDEDWGHTLGGWHVVITDGATVDAHAAVVPRRLDVAERPFRAGYIEGVATSPAKRRRGLGGLVMTEVSKLLHGEFEMGALSTGLHGFYARHGWERWRGPTFVRHTPETIRSHDEDEGVMVLRFGASKDVDLTAPLTCESRRGDDW